MLGETQMIGKNYINHFCYISLTFQVQSITKSFWLCSQNICFLCLHCYSLVSLSFHTWNIQRVLSASTFYPQIITNTSTRIIPIEYQWDRLILYSVPYTGSFTRVEHLCSCLQGSQYLKHSCLLSILPDLLLFFPFLCLSVHIGPLADAKTQEHTRTLLYFLSLLHNTDTYIPKLHFIFFHKLYTLL